MNRLLLAFAAGTFLLLDAGAHAGSMCIEDARAALKECRTGCASDAQTARDICRGHDSACAQTCRDGRDECTSPSQQILTDCLATCDPPLDVARATCKSQCACGGADHPCGFDACYIGCLNPAQSTAFQCRNACRDAFRLNTQ